MAILFTLLIWLSTSAAELRPGDVFTVTATLYAEQPETHQLLLHVPAGFAVEAPVQAVTLDGENGQVVSWRVTVMPDARPSLTPQRIVLSVDGVPRAYTSVRVCCAKWPHAQQRRLWLPLVRK